MPSPIYKLEAELSGVGAGWTDIGIDRRAAVPLALEYGIRGSGPLDRVAQTGHLRFSLDNSALNSAGRLGYYSPTNANARAGFGLGVRVRFSIAYAGVTYYKFVGWLDEIAPASGRYGSRLTECVAVDWMDHAARWPITGLPTLLNTTADAVFNTIVNAVPMQPTSRTVLPCSDVYPYALDTVRNETSSALAEFQRLAQSEFGLIYIKGDTTGGGQLVFENRSARTNANPAFTMFETAGHTASSVRFSRDGVRNRVRVIVYPRVVDGGIVTLFKLGNAPVVASGQSITIQCPYVDPTQKTARVGGTDMVAPVPGTDYAFVAVNGPDITANLGVTVDLGSDSTQVTFTNNHPTLDGTLTLFQLRGRGLYTYQPVTVESADSVSIGRYGESPLTFDMPYQGDSTLAKAVADGIVSRFKDPAPTDPTVTFCASFSDTLMTVALGNDISTCLVVAETVNGTLPFWINGVEMRVVAGGLLWVTWHLAPADLTSYWRLDDPAFQLGLNTRLTAF